MSGYFVYHVIGDEFRNAVSPNNVSLRAADLYDYSMDYYLTRRSGPIAASNRDYRMYCSVQVQLEKYHGCLKSPHVIACFLILMAMERVTREG